MKIGQKQQLSVAPFLLTDQLTLAILLVPHIPGDKPVFAKTRWPGAGICVVSYWYAET
jgi:hypothetical protein